MSLSWPFWALLSALFAAMTAILAKIGVAGVDTSLATFIRTLVVVALLTLILAATGSWREIGDVSRRGWIFLTLSGLATGASWLCYFRALSLGDVAKVAPVDKLSLVLVAVLAVIFLGERPAASEWLGIFMIACGTILIAWKG